MNLCDQYFLQALKAALQGQTIDWEEELSSEEWAGIFQMAERQRVLPMIYEAVYECPAAKKADERLFFLVKKKSVHVVMLQAVKTAEFLQLYRHLQKAGVSPLVVKGVVCRSLYPKPDHRLSGDEDLWIDEAQFTACHEAMLGFGMICRTAAAEVLRVKETAYQKEEGPLYIELHQELFSGDSKAYGEFNDFFADSRERAAALSVDGVELVTMNATDHLFYLICHALKHFVHSGFGIRQVCDITMFANTYGAEIDWCRIREQCQRIRGEQFVAAIFKIGEKYLTFDAIKACYPPEWQVLEVDEKPLLEDLLSAGIYGAVSRERLHSSTVTMNAVAAQRQGQKAAPKLLKSVFPSAKELENTYSYLRENPYLLPVAWTERIVKYGKEIKLSGKNTAVDSIRIGKQRTELLQKYKIIDKI